MKKYGDGTTPLWHSFVSARQYEKLTKNVADVDVCIVGAGISGLTTAYLLLKAKKTVLVLDAGVVASGETERTSAHITSVLDKRYFEIVQIHGKENASLIAESHNAAIDKIESIVGSLVIDCDFKRVDGYLFSPDENDQSDELEKENKTMEDLGYCNIHLVDKLPFGLKRKALRFPRQAQFHVLKYINGLCEGIVNAGGEIHSLEHVTEIKPGERVTIRTASGRTIKAGCVVDATNNSVIGGMEPQAKLAAYRTYVVAAFMPTQSLYADLYWDTAHPYHYIRIQPTESPLHNRLIIGGEDHLISESSDAEERFARLESFMYEYFPAAGNIDYRWSGQVFEPEDGIGFIGRSGGIDDNTYITTGGSGNGMTHAAISGMLLTDLICGRKNPWTKVFDPKRSPKPQTASLKENLNSAVEYAKKIMPGGAPVANANLNSKS